MLGDAKVFVHCVYILANAAVAGIVHKTTRWKGSNSLRYEYGQEYVVSKPRVGLWSKNAQHKHRRRSQRSGRAAFADRSTLPAAAIIKLDRPPIMLELSDAELRTRIRDALRLREAETAKKRAGKPALGMTAALKIHWSTVPRQGEALFGRNPTLSTETLDQRIAMKRLRRVFIREYKDALARWNAGQRDVVFPAGTVRMRLRHKVPTAPTPAFLRSP